MNTLADLLKYANKNTAQSNTDQMGLLSDLWNGFNNNPQNQRTVDSIKGMFGILPAGAGDVASGLLAADDVRRGDYLSAGLNGVGVLPYVPSLGGYIPAMAGAIKKTSSGINDFDRYYSIKIDSLKRKLEETLLDDSLKNLGDAGLKFRKAVIQEKIKTAKSNPEDVFGNPHDYINYTGMKGEKFKISKLRDAELEDIHNKLKDFAKNNFDNVESLSSDMSSSRYINLPTGERIRISDHQLPRLFVDKHGIPDFNISSYDEMNQAINDLMKRHNLIIK